MNRQASFLSVGMIGGGSLTQPSLLPAYAYGIIRQIHVMGLIDDQR